MVGWVVDVVNVGLLFYGGGGLGDGRVEVEIFEGFVWLMV